MKVMCCMKANMSAVDFFLPYIEVTKHMLRVVYEGNFMSKVDSFSHYMKVPKQMLKVYVHEG